MFDNIFIFNQETLTYENITLKFFVSKLLIITFILSLLTLFLFGGMTNDVNYSYEEGKTIFIRSNEKQNEFTPDKLKEYILELNIRFPHIVYAQSKLETGNYQSKIFLANNNLFGMKVAKKRPTTNKGEENGHAYYLNWRESVVDYAFFQAQYLSKIKTENEYFQYLSANYAEDTNYISKVKYILANDSTLNFVN